MLHPRTSNDHQIQPLPGIPGVSSILLNPGWSSLFCGQKCSLSPNKRSNHSNINVPQPVLGPELIRASRQLFRSVPRVPRTRNATLPGSRPRWKGCVNSTARRGSVPSNSDGRLFFALINPKSRFSRINGRRPSLFFPAEFSTTTHPFLPTHVYNLSLIHI